MLWRQQKVTNLQVYKIHRQCELIGIQLSSIICIAEIPTKQMRHIYKCTKKATPSVKHPSNHQRDPNIQYL